MQSANSFFRAVSLADFFSPLSMRSTSIGKQKHSARDERRKSRFHHTTNCVTNSGVSTIGASTKPILETEMLYFLAKTMRNWSRRELFAERAFFRRGVRVFTSRKRVGVGAPRTLYVSDVLSLHMLRTASAIRSPALVVLMAFEVEPSFTLF